MQKNKWKLSGWLAGALALIPAVFGGDRTQVRAGVAYESLGRYDIARINTLAAEQLAAFKTAPSEVVLPLAANAIDLYKIYYNTVVPEQGNRTVSVTGLLAIPANSATTLPLVSYQHGTVFGKDEVPSRVELSGETMLVLTQFAAQGYAVIAADYIGKGDSTEPDSYLVKASTVQACADMLTAGQVVLSALGKKTDALFLSGWSQGAWNTLVFLNALEAQGIPVQAAAMAATPADLYLLIDGWINNPTERDAAWIVGCAALFLNAYERYYGLEGLTQAAIRSEYWQRAKDFYENKIGWDQASGVFPKNIADFLTPAFAKEGDRRDNAFFKQIASNEAYRWRIGTPTRFYYGESDEVMPPSIATLAPQVQGIIGGAATQAVNAGAQADHRGAFIYGLPDQKAWFDSLRASTAAQP